MAVVVMKGFRSKTCIPIERDRKGKGENKEFRVIKQKPVQ